MDLGIKGRNALVCASSKGLGLGCAEALAKEGVNITMTARGKETLEAAAARVRAMAPGVTVKTVAGDIATPQGRADALGTAGAVDILVNNAGGPPPGDFRDWDRDAWIKALDANMLAPIELIKATLDGMIARKWGRVVNITSSSVKAPIAILGLSNGARSGLTGFVAGLARQVAPHGVTINGLLPGRYLTDRLKGTIAAQSKKSGAELEAEFAKQAASIPAGRFGTAEEFGEVCAFMCSERAAYLTGQNILLDGGNYPGTY
ncbi:SDR family oxidoreductase [Ferrovibrio sp. MS7]|jgi:3-oxoacyl-[acyl-carrier protein] reductase|uniref:SDR family oxidoreductase n=1 Tax=Ferrovibrio TaxID=1231242 RepID=UPI001B3FA880|nr:SDR family oxidoreductase [Ferrovibrio sp.]